MANHTSLVKHLTSCLLLEICRNCKQPVPDGATAATLCPRCSQLINYDDAHLQWCSITEHDIANLDNEQSRSGDFVRDTLFDIGNGPMASMLHNVISFIKEQPFRKLRILDKHRKRDQILESDFNDDSARFDPIVTQQSIKRLILAESKNCLDDSVEPIQSGYLHSPLPVGSATKYEGLVRSLIHTMKYASDPLIAHDLASLMLPALQMLGSEIDLSRSVLVPIPLSRVRHISRGFNQAELIAKQLSKISGIPLRASMLARKHTLPQHDLSREDRFKNLRGAFRLSLGAKVAPVVVLVDDIYTSGATVLEAAAALRRAGAEQVAAITVARAVLHSEQRRARPKLLKLVPKNNNVSGSAGASLKQEQ